MMNEETNFKYCSDPNCSRSNVLLSLDNFYKHQSSKLRRRSICKECFHNKYGNKYKGYNESRMKYRKLQSNLTAEEERMIRNTFDNKCAITVQKEDVSLDHFVPLSWGKIAKDFGIGGDTYANILPLNIFLNKSKSGNNPFLWIKDARYKFNINMNRWKEAVNYIAGKHGMTPLDFEILVNQCYEQIMVKKAIKALNERLYKTRKNPPYSILRYILRLGININVAVDKYGNTKAKQLVRNEQIVEYLNRMKKTLIKEIGGDFNS